MKLHLKDPGSAITHGIAMLLAIAGTVPLIMKGCTPPRYLTHCRISIFILSMILLYAASTLLPFCKRFRESKSASA